MNLTIIIKQLGYALILAALCIVLFLAITYLLSIPGNKGLDSYLVDEAEIAEKKKSKKRIAKILLIIFLFIIFVLWMFYIRFI